MITIKNLSKSFDNNKVLNNISAVFHTGKTNLIIGGSGSGKTVLLKCMVGLFNVDEGDIFYGDREFSNMKLKEKISLRKEIGMLFQSAALFDSMTVEENVSFPLNMFTDLPRKEIKERVNFCLEKVNLPGSNQHYPSELSGGMKKRVGIARAIALNPQYLYCDEPNSGLDPKSTVLIDNLIREITKEFNITTIINTHDMNSVMEIGEHIIFIYNGQKWWEGSNKDIITCDNNELNDFLFSTKFIQKIRK